MKWEIGISTGIAYTYPLPEVLPFLADSGFQGIEISTAPEHFRYDDIETVKTVKDRIDQLGLEVRSLHAPFGHDLNLTSPDAGQRGHTLERLTRAAEALRLLGGGLYVIHPGGEDPRWTWERQQRLDLSVSGLLRVFEECQRRALTLVVETPLPHLLGGQIEDLAFILDRLPAGVGVCVDTSHTSLGGSLFEAIERFSSRLRHVQASDNRGHTDDHLVPGDGIIDWARVRSSLERVGYEGTFMLEVAGEGNVAEHLLRAATLVGGRGRAPAGWPGP